MKPLFSTRPKIPRGGDAFLCAQLHERLQARLALARNYSHVVTSIGDLTVTDNVPAALAAHYHQLQPNGLFMAAFYGSATLQELRTSLLAAETELRGGAATRVAPMLAVSTAASLMQSAGFALPVIDSEVMVATYPTINALIADLRASGMTGVLAQHHPLPRAVWKAAAAHYARHFADPRGRLQATFEIVFLSGWGNSQ